MKSTLLICLILTFLTRVSFGNLPENPEEYSAWKAEFLAAIRSQENESPAIAIPKLGRWVGKLSTGMNQEQGERPVFHAAQTLLLPIPGHAIHYQDKIEKLRAEALAKPQLPPAEHEAMRKAGTLHDINDYERACRDDIPVLGMLPSAEAVAVLGQLNDL